MRVTSWFPNTLTLQHAVERTWSHSATRQTYTTATVSAGSYSSSEKNRKNVEYSTTTTPPASRPRNHTWGPTGRRQGSQVEAFGSLSDWWVGARPSVRKGLWPCKHSLMDGSHEWVKANTHVWAIKYTHSSTCTKAEEHAPSSLSLHSRLPTLMQASAAVWKCPPPKKKNLPCLAQI